MKTVSLAMLLLMAALASYAQMAPIPAKDTAPVTPTFGGTPVQVPITAPAFDLPQGAKITTEINLSESDILGMVKRAIPAFTAHFNTPPLQPGTPAGAGYGTVGQSQQESQMAMFIGMMNLDELYAAIADVKAVRIDQYLLELWPEQTSAQDQIKFYEEQFIGNQHWTRLFYSTTFAPGGGIFAVYSSNGRSFFVASTNRRGGTVVSINGNIDIEKLASWAGSMMVLFTASRHVMSSPPQPAPGTGANPHPGGAGMSPGAPGGGTAPPAK